MARKKLKRYEVIIPAFHRVEERYDGIIAASPEEAVELTEGEEPDCDDDPDYYECDRNAARIREIAPWQVELIGEHWYITHPSRRKKRIGPAKMRGVNYFDRAFAEAKARNEALGWVGNDYMGCADCAKLFDSQTYYMLKNELWAELTAAKPAKFLCLDCVVKRLGRKLRPGDFQPIAMNHSIIYPHEADGVFNSNEEARQEILRCVDHRYWWLNEDPTGFWLCHVKLPNILKQDKAEAQQLLEKLNAQVESPYLCGVGSLEVISKLDLKEE